MAKVVEDAKSRAVRCTTCAFVLVWFFLAALGGGDSLASEERPSKPLRVAVVALVVNPDRYEGAEIEVTAWGVLKYEMAALFVTEADYRHLVFENAIWLDLPEEPRFPKDAKGYMTVIGRFHSGDARGYAGRITEIKTVTVQQYRVSD